MDNTKIIAIIAKLRAELLELYPDDPTMSSEYTVYFSEGYEQALTDIINELKGCE